VQLPTGSLGRPRAKHLQPATRFTLLSVDILQQSLVQDLGLSLEIERSGTDASHCTLAKGA
jgi:hypothetical protein